jgi:phosphoribosylglycinamide formyltransferase 1
MLDPLRFTVISAPKPLNIAVLASHEGTTLQAVLDACASGRIPARVCLVISNNRTSGALRRARAAGVPARHLCAATVSATTVDEALGAALEAGGAQLVLLAGYMKSLGPWTLARFAGRVLNTHPALLPKFGGRGMYGSHVHEAVLAAGETRSGASIHLVEAGYDTGPILAQVAVPVLGEDSPQSLAARVQAAERELLVAVLAQISTGVAARAGQTAQQAGPACTPEAALAGIVERIAAASPPAPAAEITSC